MSSSRYLVLHVVFDHNFMIKTTNFWNSVTQHQFPSKFLPHISLLSLPPPSGSTEQLDSLIESVLQTQNRFSVDFFPVQNSEYLCLATENATLVAGLQERLHLALSANGFGSNPSLLRWPLVLVAQMDEIHHQQLSELQCSGMVEALRLVLVEPDSTDLRQLRTYPLPAAKDHHPLPPSMSSKIAFQLQVVFDQNFMNKILQFWTSVTQHQMDPKHLPHIILLSFSPLPIELIDAIVGSVLQTQKRFNVAFFPKQISGLLCLATENAALVEELQVRLHQDFSVNGTNTQKIELSWPLVLVEQIDQTHHQQLSELQCSGMVEALRLIMVEPDCTDLHDLKTYPFPADEHEPFRIAQEIPLLRGSSTSKGCCCKKSKCLKLYCCCFADESYCTPGICSCLGCQNGIKHIEFVNKARNIIEHTRPLKLRKGCNCLKSECLKSYCQCYEAKLHCSSECRCKGCKNGN